MPIYQREPYRSDLTGTIADLILRQGQIRGGAAQQEAEIRSRAALQQGQNRAQLFGTLGDLASNAVSGYFQQKQREQNLAPRREIEQLTLDAARRESDAAREADWNKRKAREALTLALKQGNYSVLDELPPDVRTVANGYLAEQQKIKKSMQELENAQYGSVAKAIRDFGYDLDAATLAVEVSDNPRILQAFQQVANDPEKLRQLVSHYAGPEPKPTYTQEDKTKNTFRIDPNTGERTLVSEGVPERSFQSKDVMVNGSRATVNFDPKSGKYFDQSGQEIAEVAPIPPQSQQSGGSPYFTYQPTYDAQGRPTGAIRFDARGGPPQFVDVSAMTGGGQIKPPPGTIGQQTVANEAAEAQLDRLIGMFEQGAKALIGPVEGRARSFGQGVPGVPVNTAFADFEAASSAFKNGVIKAITGAQMSEPEAKRIMLQIPSVNDKPEVWAAKAAQTKLNLQDLAKRAAAHGKGAAPAQKADPLGIR